MKTKQGPRSRGMHSLSFLLCVPPGAAGVWGQLSDLLRSVATFFSAAERAVAMGLSLVIRGDSQLCSSSFRKKPEGVDRLLLMYKSLFLHVINACKDKHYGVLGYCCVYQGLQDAVPNVPQQEVLLQRRERGGMS